MDRLEYLQRFDLPADLLDGVPAHRVTRLRRQGELSYVDGMRDLSEDRRLAILAVCTLEWRSSLADVIVETNYRIVGRLSRASERLCNTRIADERSEEHTSKLQSLMLISYAVFSLKKNKKL